MNVEMNLDMSLDVNVARLAHIRWEEDLEQLLAGTHDAVSLQSHEDCDVGLWIYGAGLAKYGHERDIWTLKETHRKFHAAADAVVDAKGKGDLAAAERAMEIVRRLSGEIVVLLTSLELNSLLRRHKRDIMRLPGSFLGALLSGTEPAPPFRMLHLAESVRGPSFFRRRRRNLALIFDINTARLAHLHWTRDLQRFFRKRRGRRQDLIQSAAECELGVWIHGYALREHKDITEFASLDAAHKRFHEAATRTVSALRHPNVRDADKAYQTVLELSREIVILLTRIELRLENSRSLTRRMQSIM